MLLRSRGREHIEKMKATTHAIYTQERKADSLRRLKAAEGQLRGLQEMIDGERPSDAPVGRQELQT